MYSPPLEGKPPSLFRKIAEVQGSLGAMQPDQEANTGQYRYKYISESQLLEAIRGQLSDRAVAAFVSVESQEATMVEVERSNGKRASVEKVGVSLAITFADGESGETFTIRGQGRADDSGDKAVYKAITSANRYLWWKTMLIPTDSDDVSAASDADYSYAGGSRGSGPSGGSEATTPRPAPTEPAPKKPSGAAKTLSRNLLGELKGLDPTRDWDAIIDDWIVKTPEWGGRGRNELTAAEFDSVNRKLEATRDALVKAGAEAGTIGPTQEEADAALLEAGLEDDSAALLGADGEEIKFGEEAKT